MPVRSLSSSVLVWPRPDEVDRSVRAWAAAISRSRAEVLRIGYFGSYARGESGVGSDLDLLVIVEDSQERFERRSISWDVTDLPVPADVFVYTVEEWRRLQGGRFVRTIGREGVWVYKRGLPN